MIVLGLLLLAVAVAVIVIVVIEGGDPVQLQAFERTLDTEVWTIFAAGVATGLLVLGGLAVLSVGIRRGQARRREIEYLRERVAEQDRSSSGSEADDDGTGSQWATNEWQNTGLGRRRPADLA